jgi:hypothetical protein
MASNSTKHLVIVLSIISVFGVIIASAAFYATDRNKVVAVGEKHPDGCTDSIVLIVVDTSNEHYSCLDPLQKIEVYPAGMNKYSSPMALVKCVCPK